MRIAERDSEGSTESCVGYARQARLFASTDANGRGETSHPSTALGGHPSNAEYGCST